MFSRRGIRPVPLAQRLGAVAVLCGVAGAWAQGAYTTKTPYQPRQAMDTYERVPKGFQPVHTQMVARHGSRGMTSMKDDLALLNLWRLARSENALTPLGEQLGPDLERLLEANALLGYGLPGISKPGYGNLSRLGMEEHRQLAQRMVRRMPELFGQLAAGPVGTTGQVRVLHSGVDRARDSAFAFVQSLSEAVPGVAAHVVEPVVDGYPDTAPVAQPAGVNRFLLYFHRLNARTDGVTQESDPLWTTYMQSQRYQAYVKGARLADKLAVVRQDPRLGQAASTVLGRLFSADFVARLERGDIHVANTGSVSFTSSDGKFTNRLEGDGKARIGNPLQALFALSSVYEIAPGLRHELGFDFTRYLPDDVAGLLGQANDAEDFYTKGPGMADEQPVTYAMATSLLQDFFAQAASVGRKGRGATLRFAHAEILVPFASILKVDGMSTPLPAGQTYDYGNSAWRGETVAPYAANVQWDTFRNPAGTLIVRMLYNERETDFQPACDGARIRPSSHFYRYTRLRACYKILPDRSR